MMLLGQTERRHPGFHRAGENPLHFSGAWKKNKVQEKYSHASLTTTSHEATAPLALDYTVGSSPGSAHSEAEAQGGVLFLHLSFSKPTTNPPLAWLVQGAQS